MTAPSFDRWNQLLIVYSICYLLLYLKYVVVLLMSADAANHPKEDEKFASKLKLLEGDEGIRLKRMLANDLENLPLQGVIFWSALLLQIFANASGNGDRETTALTVLIIVYTTSRLLHTICYYFALQPFRSISFMLAVFCTIAAAILAVNNASQIDFGNIFPNA